MSYLNDLEGFEGCAWSVASATPADLAAAVAGASSHGPGAAVVVSCQRVEAFHFGSCSCDATARWSGFDALVRLAEVASGLHSVILGEEQILGQVRMSLDGAEPRVAELGGLAVAAARTLRSETAFHAHTGHLLDRALQVAGVAPVGRIAVVGAGAVGRLVAERARLLGFPHITVLCRREPEGAWFRDGGYAFVPLGNASTMEPVDVLVTCLGSGAEPLTAASLPPVRALAVDLATPRNIAGALSAPVLTIGSMMEDERSRRHSAGHRATLRARLCDILDRRLRLAAQDSQSPVGRLRLEVERIRREEAQRTARLHPELTPEAIDAITRSLVNRVFHRPMERLRTLEDRALGESVADLFAPA
jgi:glutamyl-tRNA reductase